MSATSTLRKRRVPLLTGLTAVAITTCVVAAAAAPAAAATPPQAQSVGNFLDATVGGNTLDAVAKLQYATATAPGTQSVQNPLDATVLNALELPLTGALQVPQLAGINLGGVNQVAVANTDGSSYGASGAVDNSGGVSSGGDNNAYPANASLDTCASAITNDQCGSAPTDQLGQIKVNIGAVSGLASTPKGYGKDGATQYRIDGLDLQLGSPLLGQLLGTLTGALSTGFSGVQGALAPIVTLLSGLGAVPESCSLVSGNLPTTIHLDGGNDVKDIATIDAATGQINLSLEKLLESLDLDLNHLPANTDLVNYITDNLGKIISDGIGGLVNGLLDTVGSLVASCTPAGTLAGGLQTLLTALTGTITTMTSSVGNALTPVTDAIAPLLDVLKNVVDIGVNVQPNGPAGTYTSPLAATPKQGTPVVPNQTIVRAIEVDLLGTASAIKPAATPAAAADGSLLSLALGNAAAGPSTAPAVAPPTSSAPAPTTSAPGTNVPTGVPAGQGTGGGGSPTLPLVLVLITLALGAGGVATYRFRGGSSAH